MDPKIFWEQSEKAGQEKLFIQHEQGDKVQMALMHLSKSDDPSRGFTLVKKDLNGRADKFTPQPDSQKEWGLTANVCKDRGEFFAQQAVDNARQLVGDRAPSHEVAQAAPEIAHER